MFGFIGCLVLAGLCLVAMVVNESVKVVGLVFIMFFFAYFAMGSGYWVLRFLMVLCYIAGVLVLFTYVCSLLRGDIGDAARDALGLDGCSDEDFGVVFSERGVHGDGGNYLGAGDLEALGLGYTTIDMKRLCAWVVMFGLIGVALIKLFDMVMGLGTA